MHGVQLGTNGINEVMFKGRRLTLTRMKPISWVPWVDGKVENNAMFLTCIEHDFNDEDVSAYFEAWCDQFGYMITKTKAGTTGRAFVSFDHYIGILS